jgi:novobiocin biosynthesis protein NovU/D-mycarose 3-C-methyltransferase
VPQPDIIVARHVFCHADDWHKFMRNIDAMMGRDTLVVIEVPYAMDTFQRVEFDQIYHEHLSYLSVRAMAALLETTPLRMQHVMRFPIHGGAIVVFIRRKDWLGDPNASVDSALKDEAISLDTCSRFSGRAKDAMADLQTVVRAHNLAGRKVVGFGASAKSTVWISVCGFNQSDLAYICDSTSWKQGKLSPGTDIPIVPESELASADVAVCFAWNFMLEIEKKNARWVERGGQFINPLTATPT